MKSKVVIRGIILHCRNSAKLHLQVQLEAGEKEENGKSVTTFQLVSRQAFLRKSQIWKETHCEDQENSQ